MNNEDAIKDIVKETCEGCFYIESCRREDCAFYLAIKALEEKEADRWISVKERMPEPRVAVMVYCPEHKNQYCAFYEDKHWQVFGAYDTVWAEVTYWKPLSKAPESEDKE